MYGRSYTDWVWIEVFFSHYKEKEFNKSVIISLTMTVVFYGIVFGVLAFTRDIFGMSIQWRTCKVLLLVLVLYSLVLCFGPKLNVRSGYVLLLICVAVEIIVVNFSSVNDRERVTKEEWYNSGYYDGTKDVVDWIKEYDGSLYRTNKTYYSIYYNDAFVQGYNGLSSYDSSLSAEAVRFADEFGCYTPTNYVNITPGYDILNTLLGTKYLIARNGDSVDEHMFRQIKQIGEYTVYENVYDLGFGYLYKNEIDKERYQGLNDSQKYFELTRSFYYTDDSKGIVSLEESDYKFAEKDIELNNAIINNVNCEIVQTSNGLNIAGTEDDMQLIFAPEIPDGWKAKQITVEIEAEEPSNLQVFWETDAYGFNEEHSQNQLYDIGESTITVDLEYNTIQYLRIDPSEISQNLKIKNMTLTLIDTKPILDNLVDLQKNCVKDFIQEGNTFSGSVVNPYKEQGMLCIPLIYSDKWEAMIDGRQVEVNNINNGLIGLQIEPGQHSIQIVYCDNIQRNAQILGIIVLSGYVLFAVIWGKKNMKKCNEQ